MSFRTVGVFEKEGDNVVDALLAIPEWAVSQSFFTAVDEDSAAMGAYFFDRIETLISEDKSYIEIYMDFKSEPIFTEWWHFHGEVHEEIFSSTLSVIAGSGITVRRYFDNPNLLLPTVVLPFSEFTPRENTSTLVIS
jgi:hypothetical protein